jgi:FkbM family methyltransferase
LLVRKLAGACRRYLNWYGNLSYDVETNGEAFVLETLARFEPKLLLDVGANVGDWTLLARSRCPGAEIHAFEVSPPTHARLVERTKALPRVMCRNVGLSDAPGSLRLRHYADVPELTTATDYPHPFPATELEGRVVTGDSHAAEHGIEHVDLLKIDVEGMERAVLAGFSGMLGRRAIDLVQFEYGRVSILTHVLLRDFHELFAAHGYVVGKIFPDHVEFRPYDFQDEDFLGPNYLACREDLVDRLRAFGGRG